MVISSFKAQTTKILCKNWNPSGKKAQKPNSKILHSLKYGGDYASIANYFNQPYLIIESYYYDAKNSICCLLQQFRRIWKTSERSFYEWLSTYVTPATFKLKNIEEKDKKMGKVENSQRNQIIEWIKNQEKLNICV